MTTSYALIILLIIVVTSIPLVSAAYDITKDKRPLLGIAILFVSIHYAALMAILYLGKHDLVADCVAAMIR